MSSGRSSIKSVYESIMNTSVSYFLSSGGLYDANIPPSTISSDRFTFQNSKKTAFHAKVDEKKIYSTVTDYMNI